MVEVGPEPLESPRLAMRCSPPNTAIALRSSPLNTAMR